MQDYKFVVLEHLLLPDKGKRFWSTNSGDSYKNTHSISGELWYKEIYFTNSEEEAIAKSQTVNIDALPTRWELDAYYKTHPYE